MRLSLGRAAAAVAAPVLLLALGAGSAAGLSPGTTAAASQPRSAALATARFEPVSASFTSYRAGYVLGTRGHTRLPGAALLVSTVNGGRTWTAVAAPAVRLVDPGGPAPGTAVSAVRFADARNGWLFNPALWATHDGGRHRTWRELSYNDGGIGWRDMRYASPTVGWIVHGNLPLTIGYNGLMRTVNAGATWYNVAIP